MKFILYTYKEDPFIEPPQFLMERGYWCSFFDDKCCGWIAESELEPGNYEIITKQQFLDRIAAIHQVIPFLDSNGEDPSVIGKPYTESEILQIASDWFDKISE